MFASFQVKNKKREALLKTKKKSLTLINRKADSGWCLVTQNK